MLWWYCTFFTLLLMLYNNILVRLHFKFWLCDSKSKSICYSWFMKTIGCKPVASYFIDTVSMNFQSLLTGDYVILFEILVVTRLICNRCGVRACVVDNLIDGWMVLEKQQDVQAGQHHHDEDLQACEPFLTKWQQKYLYQECRLGSWFNLLQRHTSSWHISLLIVWQQVRINVVFMKTIGCKPVASYSIDNVSIDLQRLRAGD